MFTEKEYDEAKKMLDVLKEEGHPVKAFDVSHADRATNTLVAFSKDALLSRYRGTDLEQEYRNGDVHVLEIGNAEPEHLLVYFSEKRIFEPTLEASEIIDDLKNEDKQIANKTIGR